METEKQFSHAEALGRKKQRKRDSRLKKIVETAVAELQTLQGRGAEKFAIVHRQIYQRTSSVTGGVIRVPPPETPTYGIFLVSRFEPEREFMLRYWLRSDLDASKQNFEMLLNQPVSHRMAEGVR